MAKYTLHSFLRIATDFVPETFGRLTTIGPAFRVTQSKHTRYYQACVCVCGQHTAAVVSKMKAGKTSSCGCLVAANLKGGHLRRTHSMAGSIEYCTWLRVKNRCYNTKSPDYSQWGGRGIRVCARWLELNGMGFTHFLADMGARPSKNHSINRKDNDGDYTPENCHWATKEEQMANRTNTRYVLYQGTVQKLSVLAKTKEIALSTVTSRIKRGWTTDKALDTPIRVTRICQQ